MKLPIALFLLTAFQAAAKNGSAQDRISVDFNETRLFKALHEIERKTEYRFVFSNQVLSNDMRVTLQAKDMPVVEVLNKILTDAGLAFEIVNSKLVTIRKMLSDNFFIPVKGKVTDNNGNPLSGVSVTVKGSSKGTTTNENGVFALDANKGDVIEFSMVGYKPASVIIGDNYDLTVQLETSADKLNDIVVVGYGTTTRKKTTASVATVDIAKVATIPAQSISDGLSGRVNGVIMTASSGAPGSKAQISIRGGGTPLFVIDGVIRSQNDFENINPNDIADMSFMKDAAATAVYGSTGANGAVIITTKKGVAGKTLINYSYNNILSQPTLFPTKLSSYDKLNALNAVYVTEGQNQPTPDTILQYYKDQSKPFIYPNTDWQEVALKNWAPEQRHDLSVSTGSRLLTLYSSLSYYDQGTILKTDKNYNERITYRLNTVSNFDDVHLKVTTGIDGFTETNNIPNSSTANSFLQIFSHIQNKSPVELAYNEFGLPSANTTDNPAVELSPLSGYLKRQSKVSNILLNLDYSAPFLKGLHLKFNGNYNFWASRNKSWNATASSYANGSKVAIPGNPPTLSETRGEGSEVNLQWFVTYNKRFGEHAVDFTGVYEQNQQKSSNINAARQRYQIMFDQFLAGPTIDQLASGSEVESARAGYIGRLSYNYKQRYFIEMSGRYDGNDFYRWG